MTKIVLLIGNGRIMPSGMNATRFALIMLAGMLVTTAAAAGVRSDDPAAEKQRGDAAMDALNMDEALDAYTHAYELGHDPAILYNRGRVYQARGDYARALADLQAFEHDAAPALKARVPKLADLINDVKEHIVKLTIQCDVAGAKVTVRSVDVGATPLDPIRVNAGAAAIRVEAPDYAPYTVDRELEGGSSVVLDVHLVKKSAATPIIVVANGDARDSGGKPMTRQWWFWTGVGVVAVGAIITIIAVSQTDKSPASGSGFSPGRVSGPLVVQF